MKNFVKKFLYILGDRKQQLVLLLLLFLVTAVIDTLGIGLVGPFLSIAINPQSIQESRILAWFYQRSGLGDPSHFIALLGILIVAIFAARSCLSFWVQKRIFTYSYNQQGKLRLKLLHSYLSAPYTFHLNHNTADLINNIGQETYKFCNGVMLPALQSLSQLTVVTLLVILLSTTSLAATVSVATILLIVVGIYRSLQNQFGRWGKDISNSQAEMIRVINHSVGGFKEMRMIGCSFYFEEQLSAEAQTYADATSLFQSFRIVPRLVVETLLVLFLVGFTSISLLFSVDSGQNVTTVLGIFAMASIRLMPSVSQLTSAIASIKNSSYAFNKLYHDLKEIEDLNQNEAAQYARFAGSGLPLNHPSQPLVFQDVIELDHVTYRYPAAAKLALQDVSLQLRKGESIALIGKSGAGKTTLVDVFLGLLTPERGDIRVDGRSIYSNLRSWQNLIGYIPQSIYLMDDTIARNIAFGVPDPLIDQAKLQYAIGAAQLEELIIQLPQGLDTVIGERGARLSGGQRQRVGIARALYHERDILVLDEATAALDNETESLVTDAIRALSGTKTIIIIAHRLTTVEHCDCIYLMQDGKIVKSGSYQEVVLGQLTQPLP